MYCSKEWDANDEIKQNPRRMVLFHSFIDLNIEMMNDVMKWNYLNGVSCSFQRVSTKGNTYSGVSFSFQSIGNSTYWVSSR